MTQAGNIFAARRVILTIVMFVCVLTSPLRAQDVASSKPSATTQPAPSAKTQAATGNIAPTQSALPIQLPDLLKRENTGSTLQLVVLLTVLSLVPAILLMVTSFARILIVLTLLRQALGAQQL